MKVLGHPLLGLLGLQLGANKLRNRSDKGRMGIGRRGRA